MVGNTEMTCTDKKITYNLQYIGMSDVIHTIEDYVASFYNTVL